MEQYLIYLAPPCLGAFIGYMTNYVAIRMLFRPLKAWRFLGIRVPMTPGVIPSKREDLAENIGEMVGSHLLTSTDVSTALEETRFKNELNLLVTGRVTDIMEKDLGPIATIIPNRFQSYFHVGIKVLQGRTLKYIHNHIDSDKFAQSLADTVSGHIHEFLAKDLNSTIPKTNIEHLHSCLNDTVHKLLTNPETGKWINAYIDNKLNTALIERKTLQDLLPQELIDLLVLKIEEEAPSILAKASSIIAEPKMQDKILKGICGAIDTFISSLGPMAALVGGFLNPELIEQKVKEYLDNKGEDIAEWMQDEAVQERISSALQGKIREISSTPIADLLKNVPPEKIVEIKALVIAQVTALIQNPSVADSLTAIIRDAMDSQAERPMGDILADLFSQEGVARGQEWTAQQTIHMLRSLKVRRILDTIVINLIENNLIKRSIGPLTHFLPKKVQAAFCEYLMQATSALLIREVPSLVDSLNIKQIVTQKVNSLDLLRLENLLLSIMQEQFKYINLFGGLLGFLIGLCNLVFLL